ncbi:flagellar M-ring protein FliF [Virgibacillus profundi]|uniref:Flagellar M-ring protein n=1 Tax=Virgibacillus profundi TaxID=2024555 RepID=A0A2A2IF75_9BACI|nr:flagellar basal-body MS-ring/collar protein FliF [Virgibacillus profundi]PAV29998.1 flagellar M-ring protein FliF [Virgibacillus profundi]PXY54171.1 flagellar basal body M-ring protein FliF [Virgibacillus profundi]
MKEKMAKWKEKGTAFWTNRTKSQKGVFVGSILILILLIVGIALFTSSTKFVPLYNNLSLQEVGQIKTELDARGIPYELQDGGKTITVPEAQVDTLLVDLAGQGIPNSGNIDYSFFSENTSWGITDNEFNIMKLDAMQTELANLMKSIEGIENAKVMINMPEDPVFVSESTEQASASIVINTQPGYQFQGNQIDSLYHLVSKAVPNLPQDNIVIMNQYFEYYDRNSQTAFGTQDAHTYQQTVKKDIERDIQRRLQQMLGAMVGGENVIVSVTSDIDFTQENRTEELVEPVDLENMEGLPVSIETIQETYSGNPPVGGEPGTGEGDVPNYPAEEGGDNGEYELAKETINNEFNRIRKNIVESPYKVRDLGIQVAVDSVIDSDGNEPQYLTQADENTVEAGISSILESIIGTSIDKEYGEVIPEEKFSIVFQEFNGDSAVPQPSSPVIPLWLYIAGAVLLLIIIILIVLLLIRNKKEDEIEEVMEEAITAESSLEIPEMPENQDSESVIRRKQLEKIAKEKPEEFAKLLRSWIGEE